MSGVWWADLADPLPRPQWTRGFDSAEAWDGYVPVLAPVALRTLGADIDDAPTGARPRSLLDRIRQLIGRS